MNMEWGGALIGNANKPADILEDRGSASPGGHLFCVRIDARTLIWRFLCNATTRCRSCLRYEAIYAHGVEVARGGADCCSYPARSASTAITSWSKAASGRNAGKPSPTWNSVLALGEA